MILSDLAQASPPASTRTKPHSHQGPEIPPLQMMQVLDSNPCPTHGLINTRDENLYSLTGSGIEDIWEELKMAVLFFFPMNNEYDFSVTPLGMDFGHSNKCIVVFHSL